jgi:nicotinamidase/pyrazinamidase
MSTGLLIVDPQLDFFPGGALGVSRGDEIVPAVNELLRAHPDAPVFVTRDWHPAETRHFASGGGQWPPHCVQGSDGARFHPDLALPTDARVYSKGTDPEDDGGYSAFDGSRDDDGSPIALADELAKLGVDELLVVGLATDYCVKASVLDACKHGLRVKVLTSGVRAVDLEEGDGARALEAMVAAGAELVD